MKTLFVLIICSFLLAPALLLPQERKPDGVILSTKGPQSIILPTPGEAAKVRRPLANPAEKKNISQEQKKKGVFFLAVFARLKSK
ncbi:MAG TPA: hypothetical protein VLH56_06070 [Dissulfurispiraceae bacterium]|nr:hypothetical protein [Dissulfurispiraceae bacterium]